MKKYVLMVSLILSLLPITVKAQQANELVNAIPSPVKVENSNYNIDDSLPNKSLQIPALSKSLVLHIMPIQLITICIGVLLFALLIVFLKRPNNKYSLQPLDISSFRESNDIKVFNDILANQSFYKKDWLAVGEGMHNLLAYQFAVEAFNRYLAIDPENHEVWKKRGKSLAELHQYDEAIKSYQSALKIKDVNEYNDAYEAWLEVLRLDAEEEIDDLRSFLGCQNSLYFLDQN